MSDLVARKDVAIVGARALHDRLLDRDRELAALDDAVEHGAHGDARVLLIEGPAGIGKTRLLGELRDRAAQAGLSTAAARGGELEQGFAFGVVRQLFEPRLIDPASRERGLADAAAPAREVFATGGTDGDGPLEAPSFALLHGLYWLVANLALDGPLLIVVDDVHWCDLPSLRFLAYLVRRLEGLPVVVALGVRPAEPGTDAGLVAELASDPLTGVLRPLPLGEEAVAELIRSRLGNDLDDGLSHVCRTATGGNPLLLQELLTTLHAEGRRPDRASVAELGPRAVSRVVLVRLGRLGDDAVKIARSAAVLGDGADHRIVAAHAGIDHPSAAAAVHALVRAEILRDDQRTGFVHPLVGAAVYQDLAPMSRALEHERAARLLATAGAPPEQIAAHLLAIPPHSEQWVVDTLVEAAHASRRRGAAEGAVAYLARALAEPPQAERCAEVVLELGRAEASTSGPQAAAHLRQAYDALCNRAGRPDVALELARTLLFTGDLAEGAAVARRAAEELAPGDEHDALEAIELMAVCLGIADPDELTRLEAHRRLPVGSRLGAKMLASVAAQAWAYAGGPSDTCAELALGALAGGELIAADSALLGTVAITTLALADRDEALDGWDAALGEAHRHGSLGAKTAISLWRGFTLLRRGELVESEESLRNAADELALWGFGEDVGGLQCAALLADVLRDQGRLADARSELERFADAGDASEGTRYWCHSKLQLLVAEGRFDEAIALADEVERRFAFIAHPIETPWRSAKAIALDGVGRRENALAMATEQLELARVWGAPGTVAQALRVLGTIERDEGLERLRDAVEVARDSPARLEHARCLVALGGALRRRRQPTDAREPLRGGLELALSCDALRLAEDARAELLATGTRPRRAALSGVESLTASERRVASLAAEGATNREIAQALFVTPKTVEVHLSNSYRKLGIASRRELARELNGGSR